MKAEQTKSRQFVVLAGLAAFVLTVPVRGAVMHDDVPESQYIDFGSDPMFQSVGWIVDFDATEDHSI